jgi:hypothetical protein
VTAKENICKAILSDHPAWVPFGDEAVATIASPIPERPSRCAGFDAFRVRWSYDASAEGGTYPAPGAHPVTDAARWKTMASFPDPSRVDWEGPKREAAAIDRTKWLVQGFVEMGIFERSYLLLGMENALIACLTQGDTMLELATAIANYKIEVIRRLDDAIDMDVLWYGDDWGTQANLFLPPAVWREIVGSQTRRIYQAAIERGIVVNQHSCGKVEALMPDIVGMGAGMWNPCQPCNDLKAIKERWGSQLVLCGGIDSQFVLGKPGVSAEEVDREVKRRIYDLGPGGGYIAAPSHSVPYPDYVQRSMREAVARYGVSLYRSEAARASGGGSR